MTKEERYKELEELSKELDRIEALLAQEGITLDDSIDDEYDDDVTCEELDGVGYGLGFNLDKQFDPRYNEHILSEPDENGIVEISDKLYDGLYGKYHSKEDMLSDIISELEYYVSGKLAGASEYWAEPSYLAIDKQSNRPEIGTKAEILEKTTKWGREFDIYDIDEFEKCYWTNADDEYADIYEYELVDDSAIRKLIDKYYPDLEW